MSLPYIIICCFCILVIIIGLVSYSKLFKKQPTINDQILHNLLLENVAFYRELKDFRRVEFRTRLNQLISSIKISRVDKQPITDLDRTLIGASGIIPVFNFKHWKYKNLSEVLLYQDSFNYSYQDKGPQRNILGMVGNGALQHTMLLSRKALYDGFQDHALSNTPLHEFVHLIDMADGLVDGIPQHIIPKSLVKPWMDEIHTTIKEIKNNDVDIRKYAATNEAEFFSVVSEYLFLRPHFLQKEDPELYNILKKIYNLD